MRTIVVAAAGAIGGAAVLVAAAVPGTAPTAAAYPSGPCAEVGTVGPEQDATYTICTANGWQHVDRSVCEDYPSLFTCTVTPRQ